MKLAAVRIEKKGLRQALRNVMLEFRREVSIGEQYLIIKQSWDFPGGAVVKNLPANAGDMDSSPGPGRSHMPRSN